ncbi:hypothetical protein [Sorangium sp. So ce854]|uniref:hypothetical protein n=1 Tax=Sorangium sp. So ce854 TaxID=3133322 RepID=UPI003F6407A9
MIEREMNRQGRQERQEENKILASSGVSAVRISALSSGFNPFVVLESGAAMRAAEAEK